MKDGAAECGFHAFPLGEPGGSPVGNGLEPEHGEHAANALRQRLRGNPAKSPEVSQVFTNGEARIDAGMVLKSAQATLAGEWMLVSGDTVDLDGSRFRLEYAADHPERGGFSGAVCAQHTGNSPIGSFKRHVPDDSAVVEAFSKFLNLDHVSDQVVSKSWNSLQGSQPL